jgi:glycosyltransferase involved in cell wall biosynthesis
LSYWVAVVAKNAAEHLQSTLDSLLSQTLRSERVIIVDDGSADATPEIIARYRREHPKRVSCVTLPDKGYDIRRVPRNINYAWKTAEMKGLRTDYFMISGDDCTYQSNYAEMLVSRMDPLPSLVITSGQHSSAANALEEHVPSGSGRMVRCSFWREIGGEYPVKAGWESWLLHRALEKGLDVKLFSEVTFEHVRPRGARHQFVYWGAAMYTLGYHPLYAMGRIAKNTLLRTMPMRGSMNMLRGYLQARLGSSDAFISPFEFSFRNFVRREQLQQIRKPVIKLLRTNYIGS